MIADTVDIIKKSRNKILTNWSQLNSHENYFEDNLITTAEMNGQSSDLLTALTTMISSDGMSANRIESTDALNEHVGALAIEWAKIGLAPRDTISFIFNLKHTLLLVLQENITDPNLLHSESQKLDKLMDGISINVFETCINVREAEILRQTSEIDDIRTPIIQLWDGIVTLPIIGTLDSSRTHDVMEELLQRIAKDNVQISIIDISGVPAIDSTVAQHLLKLVTAIRLLGADCIISGIRPEIAQTIVNLGINLETLTTKPTLADALKIAFRKIEITVQTNRPATTK